MKLQKLTNDVCTLCRKSGKYILDEVTKIRLSDIEIKSPNNFVTYVDKTSEQMLVEGLSKLLPGSGFIAEENPAFQKEEFTWIIDPLDGTTNFIHGVSPFSVSVGLSEGNTIILGVILEVNLNECFYTWKESPSFLNGNKIRVSNTLAIADGLFATGFPYYDYGRLEAYIDVFRYLMQNSRGIRRLGSAAADLAYVACGRFDGFYEYGLSSWDVAAGSILVKNAGGMVCDFKGGNEYLFGREIIAVNKPIYDEFMKFFETHFK
jgi:myo-inositol-1(or 4)-monophosphatase